MNEQNADIRQNVQEHYAERARQGSSCCGGENPNGEHIYDLQLMDSLPQDVSGFSLGCGDPITLSQLKPGEVVLDLGSGGGLDCFLAARKVGASGKVIGVDMTPEMLARARQAAERLKLDNVEFRQGYLEELPVENDSVDVVISNCVINLSPDKSKVFAEVYRVLNPGGRLAVSDIVSNGELPDELKANMEAWSACAAGALPMEEFARLLEAAGLTDVKIEPTGEAQDRPGDIPEGMLFSALITARKPDEL